MRGSTRDLQLPSPRSNRFCDGFQTARSRNFHPMPKSFGSLRFASDFPISQEFLDEYTSRRNQAEAIIQEHL